MARLTGRTSTEEFFKYLGTELGPSYEKSLSTAHDCFKQECILRVEDISLLSADDWSSLRHSVPIGIKNKIMQYIRDINKNGETPQEIITERTELSISTDHMDSSESEYEFVDEDEVEASATETPTSTPKRDEASITKESTEERVDIASNVLTTSSDQTSSDARVSMPRGGVRGGSRGSLGAPRGAGSPRGSPSRGSRGSSGGIATPRGTNSPRGPNSPGGQRGASPGANSPRGVARGAPGQPRGAPGQPRGFVRGVVPTRGRGRGRGVPHENPGIVHLAKNQVETRGVIRRISQVPSQTNLRAALAQAQAQAQAEAPATPNSTTSDVLKLPEAVINSKPSDTPKSKLSASDEFSLLESELGESMISLPPVPASQKRTSRSTVVLVLETNTDMDVEIETANSDTDSDYSDDDCEFIETEDIEEYNKKLEEKTFAELMEKEKEVIRAKIEQELKEKESDASEINDVADSTPTVIITETPAVIVTETVGVTAEGTPAFVVTETPAVVVTETLMVTPGSESVTKSQRTKHRKSSKHRSSKRSRGDSKSENGKEGSSSRHKEKKQRKSGIVEDRRKIFQKARKDKEDDNPPEGIKSWMASSQNLTEACKPEKHRYDEMLDFPSPFFMRGILKNSPNYIPLEEEEFSDEFEFVGDEPAPETHPKEARTSIIKRVVFFVPDESENSDVE